MVPRGWRPPKRAATMPLKPALPVNPNDDPSVTKRWLSLPKTRMAPVSPHRAPEMARAAATDRFTWMPA